MNSFVAHRGIAVALFSPQAGQWVIASQLLHWALCWRMPWSPWTFLSKIVHMWKKMKYVCKKDFIIFFVNVRKLRILLWGKKDKCSQTSLCRNLKVCGEVSALTFFKVNFQNVDTAFFSSCVLHLVLRVWAELYLRWSRRLPLPRRHLALLHPQSPTRSRLLIAVTQSIYLAAFHFYVWFRSTNYL